MGEGSLAVVRIRFKLPCPCIELLPGGSTPECTNVGERHTRLTERIYHPRGQRAGPGSSSDTPSLGPLLQV